MKDIFCYKYNNGSLSMTGVVDDYDSFTFERSYSDIGKWQITLSGYSKNVAALKEADFIKCRENGIAGLITKKSESRNDEDFTFVVSGDELKAIAKKRIVMPPSGKSHLVVKNSSPEAAMTELLNTQIIAPTDSKRRIAGSIITDGRASSPNITYEGRFSTVSDDIITIATSYAIGWYADIEENAIVWRIFHGQNRSIHQSSRNRLIVSYDYDTMSGANIEQDFHKQNTALVAGQGEGVDRATVIINDDNRGFNRSELYVDARDIEDNSLLPQRGQEKLAQVGSAFVLEAIPASHFFTTGYRTNYDLGDTGTLKEMDLDFVLTNITEIYENGAFQLSFTFGYDANELEHALKRLLDKTQGVIAFENSPSPTPVNKGGTGAISAAEAKQNLGIPIIQSGSTPSTSIAANSYVDIEIVYPEPFSKTPIVIASGRNGYDSHCNVLASQTTKAKTVIRIWNSTSSAQNLSANWVAILQ